MISPTTNRIISIGDKVKARLPYTNKKIVGTVIGKTKTKVLVDQGSFRHVWVDKSKVFLNSNPDN